MVCVQLFLLDSRFKNIPMPYSQIIFILLIGTDLKQTLVFVRWTVCPNCSSSVLVFGGRMATKAIFHFDADTVFRCYYCTRFYIAQISRARGDVCVRVREAPSGGENAGNVYILLCAVCCVMHTRVRIWCCDKTRRKQSNWMRQNAQACCVAHHRSHTIGMFDGTVCSITGWRAAVYSVVLTTDRKYAWNVVVAQCSL